LFSFGLLNSATPTCGYRALGKARRGPSVKRAVRLDPKSLRALEKVYFAHGSSSEPALEFMPRMLHLTVRGQLTPYRHLVAKKLCALLRDLKLTRRPPRLDSNKGVTG